MPYRSPIRYRYWSDADDAKLTEMFMAGKSWAEISRSLGRTKGSCQSRGLTQLSLARKRDLRRPTSTEGGE